MTAVKTKSVTFRILPEIKAALRKNAEREHRSLANMLEVMIRDYSRRDRVPGFGQPAQAMFTYPLDPPRAP